MEFAATQPHPVVAMAAKRVLEDAQGGDDPAFKAACAAADPAAARAAVAAHLDTVYEGALTELLLTASTDRAIVVLEEAGLRPKSAAAADGGGGRARRRRGRKAKPQQGKKATATATANKTTKVAQATKNATKKAAARSKADRDADGEDADEEEEDDDDEDNDDVDDDDVDDDDVDDMDEDDDAGAADGAAPAAPAAATAAAPSRRRPRAKRSRKVSARVLFFKDAGNEAFVAKEFEIAVEKYLAAIAVATKPRDKGPSQKAMRMLPALYANLAASHLALGQHAEAAAAATQCLRFDPGNLKAFFRLADAQRAMGDSTAALETLTRALALDDGLYSDKGKARLMKAVRKSRSALLDALEEAPILSYSFADDGKPSVRVYVTLKGVGALPREDILADFERQALDLRVRGYEGRTMRLYAPELWAPIDPAKCKVKVKPDMVMLSLRKKENDGMRPWEKLRR